MKTCVFLIFASLILNLQIAAAPAGSAFTYQGQLQSGGLPAKAVIDFQFSLWDGPTNGTLIGSTQTVASVTITNGLFRAALDFGVAAFDGQERWLEIGVRPSAGGGNYIHLSPRQAITATPYALVAGSIVSGGVGAPSLAASNNFVGINTFSNPANVFAGGFAGSGVGLTNVPGTFHWQIVSGTAQLAQANSGYIVNNSNSVTVTLPATPAIGDVVRICGIGTGSWKLVQNAGQTILTTLLGPVVGVKWTARDSQRNWYGVASSADGSKLVALDNGGFIYCSSDYGSTWAPADSPRNWWAVTASVDGAKLAAIVRNGQIFTSTNSGVTWASRESARNWQALVSSSDGAKLAAVVNGGQIYTSLDSGSNWIARGMAGNWTAIASSADGNRLAAVSSSSQIYTSADHGTNWTARESTRNWISIASSADGIHLVACVNGGQIYTSDSAGVNWTSRESNRSWLQVISSADGSRLAALVSAGQIYLSSDSGATWLARDTNRAWTSIACSADGTRLVASVQSGYLYTSAPWLLSNTALGTTGSLVGGADASAEVLYVGSGQFKLLTVFGSVIAY